MSIYKLEIIKGMIYIDDLLWPFSFNTNDFILETYPPTKELFFAEKYSYFDRIKEISKEEKDKWLDTYFIEGFTSNEYIIKFYVRDRPSISNGYRKYEVIWVIYYKKEYDGKKIDGFSLSGGELDIFFPAKQAYSAEYKDANGKIIDEISVTTKRIKDYYPCGKYNVTPNVEARVGINAYSTYLPSKTPFSSLTTMRVTFNSPLDIKTTVKSINDIRLFLYYAFYRTNIFIPDVEICWLKEGKFDYAGRILSKKNFHEEKDKNVESRVISYRFWQEHIGELLTIIEKGELGFQHICDSIDSTRHYPLSRAIMIFAEFEREFLNIYGQDVNRSEEYKTLKDEILHDLEKKEKTKTGKQKKYIKDFIKIVKYSGNSYENYVIYALKDCIDIMNPFLILHYGSGNIDKTIDDIAERANAFRNSIAHSRLDFEIKPKDLDDIRIIEELAYAIRLKAMGNDYKEIQKALGNLFGEKIGIIE